MDSFLSSSIILLWTGSPPSHSQYSKFASQITQILSRTRASLSPTLIFTAFFLLSKVSSKSYCLQKKPSSEFNIFITSLIIADIYLNDNPYRLKSWSELSEISIRNLVIMKKEFLEYLDYDINVTTDEYQQWVTRLYPLIVLHYSAPVIQSPLKSYPTPESYYSHQIIPYEDRERLHPASHNLLQWSSSPCWKDVFSSQLCSSNYYPIYSNTLQSLI